jgi:NADPH:quinone reductase-like Zn-dependent oxidoreductase
LAVLLLLLLLEEVEGKDWRSLAALFLHDVFALYFGGNIEGLLGLGGANFLILGATLGVGYLFLHLNMSFY